MTKKKTMVSLSIKSVLVIVAFTGIIKGLVETGPRVFLFFTQLSNLFVALVSLVLITFDINKLSKDNKTIPNWLNYLKFSATIGITLTFIVFWALLAKDESASYLRSFNNLSLHTIVPILAITEYVLFTKDFGLTKKGMTTALIPPLAYFIFAMILMAFNVSFGDGKVAPYFFLNYKELGWFGFSGGLGVFYWIIIVLSIIYVLAYVVSLLHNIRLKQQK